MVISTLLTIEFTKLQSNLAKELGHHLVYIYIIYDHPEVDRVWDFQIWNILFILVGTYMCYTGWWFGCHLLFSH